MKLSLKFGKIIRNCLRNSAVSFKNHNENYNASGKISNWKSIVTTLFEHRSQQKPFKRLLDLRSYSRYQCTKKREIINYDKTMETNRIKLTFQKFCQKHKFDLEKRLITPNLVVIRQWLYKWKLKQ